MIVYLDVVFGVLGKSLKHKIRSIIQITPNPSRMEPAYRNFNHISMLVVYGNYRLGIFGAIGSPILTPLSQDRHYTHPSELY